MTARETSTTSTTPSTTNAHQAASTSRAAATRQPADRLVDDDAADDQQERALGERGEVLGLAVAVGVVAVGRPDRDAQRVERQERRDEVGAGVRRLGDHRQRAGEQARDELQRDEEDRRRDREQRGALLRRELPRRRRGRGGSARRQPCQELAGGAAAVADRVLLGGRQLGHRAPVRVVDRDERRVVAEAARPARRRRQRARAAPLERLLLAARRVDERDRADVLELARPSGTRSASSLREVVRVGRVLAGPARRAHARLAAERRHLDPRVVGDRRRPGRRGRGARLAERVLGEGRRRSPAAARPRRAARRPRARAAARRTRAALCALRVARTSRISSRRPRRSRAPAPRAAR